MKRNLTAGTSARRGFTLPEILVVMLIIAVLVALLSAAAAKFRDAQMATTTDAQLSRLQGDLNDTYSRSVQRCRTEDRPSKALIDACGNPDIAQAVHLAATLKASFPESYTDATTTVSFTVGGSTFSYPPKKTFNSLALLTPTAAGMIPADKQRAILLYLILTERGSSESGSPGERRTENLGGKDFTYFVDLYGQPITYYRWGWLTGSSSNGELNGPPFIQTGTSSPDPLDPQKWVFQNWTATNPNTTMASATDIATIRSLLSFGNNNRIPTVVSNGRNKQFNGTLSGTVTTFGGDDQVGYRLNRLGGQGQQGN